MRELLSRIAFVHKCVGCNKILAEEDFDRAFCFDCKEIYLVSKMEICPECALEVKECSCMPKLLKKEDAVCFRKLFFYNKNKQSQPQNRLIYYLKRNKSLRVIRDVARELEPIIKKELDDIEVENDAILVSVPRSKSAAAKHGFDQSALICKELSILCGIEFVEVLKRKRGGKPQKMLTAGERKKNIGRLLYANKKVIDKVAGKTVVLVDDVVTTGASMSACIEILREACVKNIICVALSSDINL